MFIRIFISLVVVSFLSLEAGAQTFEYKKKPIVKVPQGQEYDFGYLVVPENRSTDESRDIKLPVYIFKSRNSTDNPDPVVYLVGGPGSSIMNVVPYIRYYQYANNRDFILLEQRGTAYAKPSLDCPEWAVATDLVNYSNFTEAGNDSIYQEAANACRKRLVKKGIDLNGYRTREIAQDVEDLRVALGYEQLNILSLSYGTKIAQVLIRDFPGSIRSVVMDSPLPLEVSYDLESNQNVMESYERLFGDCTSEFPDLGKRFFRFLEETTREPIEINLTNPRTRKEEIFRIEGGDLFFILANASTAEVPFVPYVLEEILSGDYSKIEKELMAYLNSSPGDGTGLGMRLSVWCAEETPFISDEELRIAEESYPSIKGVSPAVFDPAICRIWDVTPEDQSENQPVKSNVPVLIINGEYDAVTPVKWGQNMLENLPNSFHLIFQGYQHTPTTYWDNPCGMETAKAFFDDPSQKPALSCFSEIKTPVFETN